MLTRLLRGALESKLEYGRPAEPELICTCHETIKIVGENPDNHYLGASLDGKYDYRIWGTRGEAKWISFNLFSGRRLRRRRAGHRRHACTRSRCTSSPTAPSR